jgi:sugar lactone lactonase YvrE
MTRFPVIIRLTLALLAVAIAATGCTTRLYRPGRVEIQEIASLDRQWSGLTFTRDNRMFVTFPRWRNDVPFSVAEILPSGSIVPYPDREWNTWRDGLEPDEHFICTQSVWADDDNNLWVLDAANPQFEGVIDGGAKLVRINLTTNKVTQTIVFDKEVALTDSYLNDVRINPRRNAAYISDSGRGAIIVVDLDKERARRMLDGHPSTQTEEIDIVIDGQTWRPPKGYRPRINVDALALDTNRRYLYFQALTGRTLYRIHTRWLHKSWMGDEERGSKVEIVKEWKPCGSMEFDLFGNLYLANIEESAVSIYMPNGRLRTLVTNEDLQWPDTIAVSRNGTVFVSTSRINLDPDPQNPYKIFKLNPVKKEQENMEME